jgi:hypothetical protein
MRGSRPRPALQGINLASRKSKPFALDHESRATLERWARRHTAEQRLVRRSRIILLLDRQMSARAVARALGTSRHTVDMWRRRFEAEGLACIMKDRPGRGRRRRSGRSTTDEEEPSHWLTQFSVEGSHDHGRHTARRLPLAQMLSGFEARSRQA